MKVTLYLRREVLRMHVHPDADFSDYWTVLETVAHSLTPHLPDRVSPVAVPYPHSALHTDSPV